MGLLFILMYSKGLQVTSIRIWKCLKHLYSSFFVVVLQWGTADAEIKTPSVENPELTNVLLLKPGVEHNVAMHASPSARNFFLVLSSAFLVHSPSLFPDPLPTL